MKTWMIRKHGGPEVLKQEEVSLADLKPPKNWVPVRVKAVALNHLDLWVRNGIPGVSFPLPMIPGCDVAGVREDTGEGVLVNPILSCGRCPRCQEDYPALCKKFGLLGETTHGGCAEKIWAPPQNLIPLTGKISFEQAAALPIAYLTAWHMLKSKAGLKAEDLILIQAGGSGVSVAAIQIAKLIGAQVIATASEDSKLQKLQQMGVKYVINYKKESFGKRVKEICKENQRRGVQVAMDHVGVMTFSDTLKCLDWGGKLVTCGATTGSQVQIDLKPIFFKNLSILGSTMGRNQELREILSVVESGRLEPVIDSVYPLSQLPEAMSKLESRTIFGKVVLQSDF